MSALMGMLLKVLFTEKMIKKLILTLGNYLVKSSKNKLDDIWFAEFRKNVEKS